MTTIGDLTPNLIGRKNVCVTHEGATVAGELRALDIETSTISDGTYADPHRVQVADVRVTITLGSITLGPLDRSHPCELLA